MKAAEAVEAHMPLRLRCSVQNYDWGRSDQDSTVGRLFARNSGKEIESGRLYAEFWMGTHQSGPSFVELGRPEAALVTLKSWVEENPSILGEKVVKRWGKDLPFLFKILSVSKTLSIQAHPNKELASFLHKTQPEIYKDANHKPEMAIALSEFKALCGFVSVKELKDVLTSVPEILELVGQENASKVMSIRELGGHEEVRAILKCIFTQLMTASKEVVSEVEKKLTSRLTMEHKDFPEILHGVYLNPYIRRYTPPSDEFEVDCCLLPPGDSVALFDLASPSILLVFSGEGGLQTGTDSSTENASEGDVFFVPAETGISINAGADRPLQLYRAGVNSKFFQ